MKDVEFCEGSSVILDAGDGTNYTYLWNTGATTQKISVDREGFYTVTIDNGSCSEIFSGTASYLAVPMIDTVSYEKNTLTINITRPAPPVLEYSINSGVTWQNGNVFSNILPNQNYGVAVRIPNALCFVVKDFFTFYISNVITPNADGINDEVDFSGVSKYKDFSAVIIDRYGNEIFRGTVTDTIWKASYRQATAPSASYWYQVSWLDPVSEKVIQKNGWILLKNRN